MNKLILPAILALAIGITIAPSAYAGVENMTPDFVSEQFEGQEMQFVYDEVQSSVSIVEGSNWLLDTQFSNNSFTPADGVVSTLTGITSNTGTTTFGIPSAYVVIESHLNGETGKIKAIVNGNIIGYQGFDQQALTYKAPLMGEQLSIEFQGCNVSFTDVRSNVFGNGIIEDCQSEQTPFLKGNAPGLVLSGIYQTTN